MKYELYSIPQIARCFTCSSEEIIAVCHHCGRPLCREHLNKVPEYDPRQKLFNKATGIFIFEQKIPEFYQLKLPKKPQRGYFFDSGTMPVEYISDDIHYIWEWIKYIFEDVYNKLFLYILGRPIRSAGQHDSTAHCEYCLHFATSFFPLIRTGFILIIFNLLLFSLTSIGYIFTQYHQFKGISLIALFGGTASYFIILVGVFLNISIFIPQQRRSIPEYIPVDSTFGRVKVVEKIHGEIQLNKQARYLSYVTISDTEPVAGEILVQFQLDERSFKDAEVFKEKARLLGIESLADKVQLGFLALNGVKWQLINCSEDQQKYGEWQITQWNDNCHQLLVPLNQPGTTSLLEMREGTRSILTKRAFFYHSSIPEIKRADLPFQMVVSFSRDIEQRAIEIEVEITEADIARLEGSFIYCLDIEVPYDLGQIATVYPTGKIDPKSHYGAAKVSWQKLFFEPKKTLGSYRKNIIIQFQDDLPNFQNLSNAISLAGNIELHIPVLSMRKAAFKSITSTGRVYKETLDNNAVLLFDAFGNIQSIEGRAHFETYITANFKLDLRGLRPGKTYRDKKSCDAKGVAPNNYVIANIIDKLNEQKIFYIKRVTENPPPISKANANKVQHYWDIHGRAYEGVFPIDFHIVFTGEEDCNDQSQSKFYADINTEAVITNQDMEDRAINVLDRLQNLIETALSEYDNLKSY